MKWNQETYARDLKNDLARHLALLIPSVEPLVAGRGANWHCKVNHGGRSVTVHCFDAHGPEYLCSFDENGQVIAMGRTPLRSDLIPAVGDWFQDATLENLYGRFDFVDGQKRRLLKIAETIIEFSPELGKDASHELNNLTCDLYALWFRQQERACRIYYYGKDKYPNAVFFWDECELFRFIAEDLTMLASVLKRWLCDSVTPSVMRVEFPWIDIGELATYYEQGRPIEGEFVMSWKSIERFFAHAEIPPKQQILHFVAEIRQHGYDKTLRAGQSMYSLVLSRSRRHGLRQNQSHLVISFKNDGMEIRAYFPDEQISKIPQIAFLPQVEALLQHLVSMDID